MKKCFKFLSGLALAFALSACSMSTAMLEEEVLDLFNEEAEETGLYATNVTLVHVEGNEYTGIITVLMDGVEADFDIEVMCDGRSFTYQIYE